LLKVNCISTFINSLKILVDVSLHVENGEIVALMGANGAGKTTLVNTIVGLLHPKSGTIEFQNERIDTLEPHEIKERGVSVVPEGRRIFPYMTVLENLEIGAYTKMARKQIEANLEWIFNIFPILKERKNQLAGTLSGGEQQMLSIGRALMSRPKLCLLDEISLGLSPIAINIMYKCIKEINSEGVSLLLVEQNLKRVMKIADRGYVLEKGRIVWEGERKNIKEDELRKKYFGLI
jgi:branched-chain amino acid transport system ATP-binding protein